MDNKGTLREVITRVPYTEYINREKITYQLVNKVAQTALFTNERFLILRGTKGLGYCKSLPTTTTLPLRQIQNIPPTKVIKTLNSISSIEAHDKKLFIRSQREQDWEFILPNKESANKWRLLIESAIMELKKPIQVNQFNMAPASINKPFGYRQESQASQSRMSVSSRHSVEESEFSFGQPMSQNEEGWQLKAKRLYQIVEEQAKTKQILEQKAAMLSHQLQEENTRSQHFEQQFNRLTAQVMEMLGSQTQKSESSIF